MPEKNINVVNMDIVKNKDQNLDAVVHHHIPVLTSQDLDIHWLAVAVPSQIIPEFQIVLSDTWKTVKQAWKKSSKVARDASGPNLPPNN